MAEATGAELSPEAEAEINKIAKQAEKLCEEK
jgi:hypothetical protein